MNKLIQILLSILIVSLALINSHFLDLFGFNLDYLHVNGNYEFTKVMYFNIFSSIIILLFVIKNIIKNDKIIVNKSIYYLIFILLISSIFSLSPYISFFGNNSKAHSFFMFLNLIGIFIIVLNSTKQEYKTYIKYIIISSFIVSILAIWQFYIPSFDYGDLSNRAIASLGHPNYLVLFLILSIPLILEKIKNNFNFYYILIFTIVLFCAFLTKSIWGIFLILSYLIYISIKNIQNKKIKKIIFSLFIILLITNIILILDIFGTSKIYSFLSRFYIWESILGLSNNINSVLLGNGLGTLDLIFESNKSINLYIYENIGFTADRPHNIFLYIFYSMGALGLLFFLYILKNFAKNFDKNNFIHHSIILSFLYLLLNFASIVSYLILTILIAINAKESTKKIYLNIFLLLVSISTSLFSLYFSINYYIAETYYHKKDYENSIKYYPLNAEYYYKIGKYENGNNIEKIKTENYFYSKIKYNLVNIENNCLELTNKFPSAENYFYCGEYFEYLGKKELSNIYYKNGLKKLPDLWNENSSYFNNIFIDKEDIKHRFFSEKYSDIKNIIENKIDK